MRTDIILAQSLEVLMWRTQNIHTKSELRGRQLHRQHFELQRRHRKTEEKQQAADKKAEKSDCLSVDEGLWSPAPPKYGVGAHFHKAAIHLGLHIMTIVV